MPAFITSLGIAWTLTMFCLRIPRPPGSTLFPYTTLFRSGLRERTGGPSTCLLVRGTSTFVASRDPCDSTNGCPSERSEEHTSELQSRRDLVCRLLLEKKKSRDSRLTRSTPTPQLTMITVV